MKDNKKIINKVDEIIEAIDASPDYGSLAMVGLGIANWVAPGSDKKKIDILFNELKDILVDYYIDKADDEIFKPFFDDTVYLNYTWRKNKKVKRYLNDLKNYLNNN